MSERHQRGLDTWSTDIPLPNSPPARLLSVMPARVTQNLRYFLWWQPTPIFLPGNFHGQGSLAGYSLWGRQESDMTEHEHTP